MNKLLYIKLKGKFKRIMYLDVHNTVVKNCDHIFLSRNDYINIHYLKRNNTVLIYKLLKIYKYIIMDHEFVK